MKPKEILLVIGVAGGALLAPLFIMWGMRGLLPGYTPPPQEKMHDAAEVAKHNTDNDCWVVVDGLVFDVTSASKNHPGMFRCSNDVSENYHKNHGAAIRPQMLALKIGKLSGKLPSTPAATAKNAQNATSTADIARDPNDVPPPITRTSPSRVKIDLETKEVTAELADGVQFNYWTFNGTVPGPLLRIREGDTVEMTLKNNLSSGNSHNIDFHAVTGPGGGAVVTNVAPGESKTLIFKALNPGLFVYHCAYPNVPTHVAHGMYGLILVEPKEGLSKVDKEFYVMQGEVHTAGALGEKGMQAFDRQKMLSEHPEYIVFNGRVGGLNGKMKARVGDTVRLFVGNGGVNLISSFHVIGEIFDLVYPEGSMGGAMLKNAQTTIIPAGGAAIVEFGLEIPGRYIFVDHALSRLDRGASGVLEVEGAPNKEIYDGISGTKPASGH